LNMDARRAWSTGPMGQPMALILADLMVLAKLATPVVIARLGIMGMGLTDALVVGRYSAIQLGYHALGWAPTAVVLVVSISLLSGIQVMTSRS
jgi:MATE family multidrug resistance protein